MTTQWRRVNHRRPASTNQLQKFSLELLKRADEIFQQSGICDTAVGDTISQGLAYLVYCAFDGRACDLRLKDAEFEAFISTSTAQWFRERGFAEWFCQGAASLFRTSHPRYLMREPKLLEVKIRRKR